MVSSDKACAYYEPPRRTKKCIVCVLEQRVHACVVKYEHQRLVTSILTNYHLASVHNDFVT